MIPKNVMLKLKVIKGEVTKANNAGILEGIYWRVRSIVEREFESGNVYSKLLGKITNLDYNGELDRNKGKLMGVIDHIFDDHEDLMNGTESIISVSVEKKVTDSNSLSLNKKVFVVHGHNEIMKQSVARVMEKIGLNPIILHEQPDNGLTIIEKFLSNSDVGFAIVLLSSDDFGYSKLSGDKTLKERARQNVIFELGFFVAKLSRQRVVALVENSANFELPSDYNGVLYVPFDGSDGTWKLKLSKELKANGYQVDTDKIM